MPADIPLLSVQSGLFAQNLAAVQRELDAVTTALQKGDEAEARRHLGRDFPLSVQAAENNIVTMKRYYLQTPTDAKQL